MIHRSFLSVTSCLVAICLIGSTRPCEAAIIVGTNFITIDADGNPSDGLQYLNMSFSDGLTQAAAIANGVANGFAGTRVATPAEFDDLFAAAGIMYNGAETAADGFTAGLFATLSSGTTNYDAGLLSSQLGFTQNLETFIWTDPDGNASAATTRDILRMSDSAATIFPNGAVPVNSALGWLLVNGNASSSAVPEPSSFLLLALTSLGALGISRTRKRRQQQTS